MTDNWKPWAGACLVLCRGTGRSVLSYVTLGKLQRPPAPSDLGDIVAASFREKSWPGAGLVLAWSWPGARSPAARLGTMGSALLPLVPLCGEL